MIIHRIQQRLRRLLLMLRYNYLALCIEHLLVRSDNTEDNLLVHCLGRSGSTLLEQIGTPDLLLRLERIEG